MKNILLVIWVFGLTLHAKAQDYSAEVTFFISNAGALVDGTFQGFDAEMDFNSDDLENSSIKASVGVNTIETGIDLRDKHLKAKGYFFAEQHPKISMESNKFMRNSEGNYTGIFELTIKGITREVEVPFTYTKLGNTAQYMGEFTIDRLDFEVGNRSLFIGREVKIEVVVKEF